MSVENFKSCSDCKHKEDFGGPKFYCYFGPMSRPCSEMRQGKGMCGSDGNLWEKRDANRPVHAEAQRD